MLPTPFIAFVTTYLRFLFVQFLFLLQDPVDHCQGKDTVCFVHRIHSSAFVLCGWMNEGMNECIVSDTQSFHFGQRTFSHLILQKTRESRFTCEIKCTLGFGGGGEGPPKPWRVGRGERAQEWVLGLFIRLLPPAKCCANTCFFSLSSPNMLIMRVPYLSSSAESEKCCSSHFLGTGRLGRLH